MIIPCPRCSAGLTGGTHCPACGLPLTGPTAAALWEVDQQLGVVDQQLARLQTERRTLWSRHVQLLATLGGAAPTALPTFGDAGMPSIPPPPSSGFRALPTPPPAARPRQEWTPRRVQNLLLSLGAVLLVIAGAIFTAVSWRHLGAAVRGTILLALTAAFALGARTLARRGLAATAEALSGVCVGLGFFDAYALRALALPDVSRPTYWTVATAVLALAAAGLARLAGVRLPVIGAALLTLTPLLVACAGDHSQATRSVLVSADALLASVGLVVLRRRGIALPDVRVCWRAGAVLLGGLGFAMTGTHILYGLAGQPLALVETGVVLCGIAAALTAWGEATTDAARQVLAGAAALCALCTLGLPFEATLTDDWWAIALIGCALVVALVAWALPRPWRTGPALTAAIGAALAGSSEAPSLLDTLVGQLGWAARPWTAAPATVHAGARSMLFVHARWTGVANLVALVGVAAVALAVGRVLDRLRWSAMTAGALLALGGVVAVPQLDGAWGAGLLADVAVAATGAGLAVMAGRRGRLDAARVGTGTALAAAVLAVGWSLALPWPTGWVAWAVTAILAGALVLRVPDGPVYSAAAVVAAAYAVAGATRTAGAGVGVVGLAVACVPLVLTVGLGAYGRWFGGRPRFEALTAEVAALVVCLAAVDVASPDRVWQGRAVPVAAVAGLVATLRPERRRGLAVGVAALSIGLTQLLFSEGLSGSSAVAAALALCALSLAAAWLISGRDVARPPELVESRAVLAVASLVQGVLAAGAAVGSASTLTVALVLLAVLYGTVAALPDPWWDEAGLLLPVRGTATAVATLALLGSVAAAGDAAGWSAASVGLTVAVVAALLAAGATWLRRRQPDSRVVEAVAALAAVPAIAACSARPSFAGWVLAIAGVTVLLSAGVRPERRRTWPLGALLCSAATWTWLRVAGVEAPEPYTDPIALVALWAGLQRRRSDPGVPSLVAYGPGLSGLLLPSLAFALVGDGVTRPLLLAALATAVVVLGAQHRLRAPLLLGSATLLLSALRLLAPYEALVPRWLEVGTAGALLLALGATYEQRRRDLEQLRTRYDALA